MRTRFGDAYARNGPDAPVIIVVPGELHVTQPHLDNARAAYRVVDEVNNLIRPNFVQFIGDNVQDATVDQFRLFDEHHTDTILCNF